LWDGDDDTARWRRFSLALSLKRGIDDKIEDDDENDYYCYDYYDEEPPWCFATNQNKENVSPSSGRRDTSRSERRC
jgi:hypothetical protein